MEPKVSVGAPDHSGQPEFSERMNAAEYAPVQAVLPLREAYMTQIAPGHYSVSTTVATAGHINTARTSMTCPALVVFADLPGRPL